MVTVDELSKRCSDLRQELIDIIQSSFHNNNLPISSCKPSNDDAIEKFWNLGVQDNERMFLSDLTVEDKLISYVILMEASNKNYEHPDLIHELLLSSSLPLAKRMLLADGAKEGQYGSAYRIYQDIHKIRKKDEDVLENLVIAICCEHAVSMRQSNPTESSTLQDTYVNPVKRYQYYEDAYINGELDPSFPTLTIWELRHVVNGDEPDEISSWGRQMLRSYYPEHLLCPKEENRYVSLVNTNIRYGSQDVKYDRPELQLYQNILMNGGICGRRAFFGRFMLRAFGIPTAARPSTGHGALCHWTYQSGWIVKLGPAWGSGWTHTIYVSDLDFLDTTKARRDCDNDIHSPYVNVKRAQWIGDVFNEKRVYGRRDPNIPKEKIGYWYGLSLRLQKVMIEQQQQPVVKQRNSSENPTLAEKMMSLSIDNNVAKQIISSDNDTTITIPACAIPDRTKEVQIMKSFTGGYQIYLPTFAPQGLTVLRGGTWKCNVNQCTSGNRLLSGGYGKYEDWGFRVAYDLPETSSSSCPAETIKIDLRGTGQCIELVYIKPGKFVMGGENTVENKFACIEVPHHPVEITKGYYIGKYPITQVQYEVMMKNNPSKSTKDPNCPVDTIGEDMALDYCFEVLQLTGHEIRLPTEAEWEYACRAGSDTKWFFGNDADTQMKEYAWYNENSDKKSHPVGLKKPNPWGLYDMYGNVWERCSDKYDKNYYKTSPVQDPKGPTPGICSKLEYRIPITTPGKYALTAEVVTVNYHQRLVVNVNCTNYEENGQVVILPFTNGLFMMSSDPPIVLDMKQGENILRVWRNEPPQYSIAIKKFVLKRIN